MFIRLLAGLLFACLWCGAARAELGTIDNVPAATLLIPYFEVRPDDPNGVRTVITLHNASASAAVARVTLWTDLGLPTLSFNLYLTGYDAETINLRSVFNREVPFTADAGDDPQDNFSPQGNFSQDINFPGAGNGSPAALGSSVSRELLVAHTGGASQDFFGGNCGARVFGDGVARGYVTIDDMSTQTQANHLEPTYTVAGNGLGTRNILMGEYVIVDPATSQVVAENAVAIEANNSLPPGPSFYARFRGNDGQDRREALPTAWAGRYSAGRTDLAYWRDPGVAVAPFPCGGSPAGLPNGHRHLSVFDAGGNLLGNPGGNPFPFFAGEVEGDALGLTAPLGWLFANLNPPAPAPATQSWLMFRQIPPDGAAGSGPLYSVPGVQLGQGSTSASPIIP
jgi:hypothetical protein